MKFNYGDLVYSLYDKSYGDMMIIRYDTKTNRYLCICNDGLDLIGSIYFELLLEDEIALLNDNLLPGSLTYNSLQEIYLSMYPNNMDTNYYDIYQNDKNESKIYRKAFRHSYEEKIHLIEK